MMTEGPFPVEHAWPAPGEHWFTKWQTKTGLPKATQYRTCIHPDCPVMEERDAPRA